MRVFGFRWLALVVAAPILALLYPDDPPIRHTGGFGEPTCHACHFDSPLNSPGATLEISGVPDAYSPDSTYELTIAVLRRALGAGGFSMTARFRDGRQAGVFDTSDDRATIRVDSIGVQYALHTLDGTKPASIDSIGWKLDWTSPSKPDSVVFHLAANAANGDDSEFGDLIRTASVHTVAITQ